MGAINLNNYLMLAYPHNNRNFPTKPPGWHA
jgi:hypothetical protein